MAGNPVIQVRLHQDIKNRLEKRSRELGFITPAGKANLSGYVHSLIMRDINSGTVILDGQSEEYKIR